MMRASRELIASLQLVDNGQVFISGYSQGGHAGMALHKYIEDNELLEEFDVHVSGLGSGPYNLSGTQTDLILSDEPYSNPGYLVYVLASYDLAYDNLYDTYSDILQSPYDGIVVPFFSGTNTTLNMTSLNAQLPSTVAELIQPDVLSALETDLMHPLRLDLMDNDNYDWAPVRPINMYYCTQDEQVFFSNSLDADSAMAANGSTAAAAIFSGDTDHGGCFFPSMVSAITSFEEVKEGCVTSLREVAFKVGIGPNPVQTVLNISSVEPISRIELFNVRGQRLVDDTFLRVQSAMTFDVRDLPKGQYQIRLTAQNGKVVTKSLIKE